jgi:general secretion pathway protein F
MSLGDAMASTESGFPDYLIATVRAGQAGGALEDILARLAEFLERSQKLRDKVRSALIYPAILGVLAALSLVVLVTVVIPEFRPLFEDVGADLPLPTRVVMAAADFLETYWWLLLFSIVAGVLVIRAQLRRPSVRYKWDGWKLGLPLLGVLLTEARVAVFSRLMSTLVHNGIPLPSALELSRRSLNNAALIGAIEDVSERVREGDGLARPLGESGLFPDLAVDLIRVGEETGDLEAMLRRIAEIHDDSVERRLAHLVALLVPVLTIGLGVIIAGVIVSILVAVLSINQLVF